MGAQDAGWLCDVCETNNPDEVSCCVECGRAGGGNVGSGSGGGGGGGTAGGGGAGDGGGSRRRRRTGEDDDDDDDARERLLRVEASLSDPDLEVCGGDDESGGNVYRSDWVVADTQDARRRCLVTMRHAGAAALTAETLHEVLAEVRAGGLKGAVVITVADAADVLARGGNAAVRLVLASPLEVHTYSPDLSALIRGVIARVGDAAAGSPSHQWKLQHNVSAEYAAEAEAEETAAAAAAAAAGAEASSSSSPHRSASPGRASSDRGAAPGGRGRSPPGGGGAGGAGAGSSAGAPVTVVVHGISEERRVRARRRRALLAELQELDRLDLEEEERADAAAAAAGPLAIRAAPASLSAALVCGGGGGGGGRGAGGGTVWSTSPPPPACRAGSVFTLSQTRDLPGGIVGGEPALPSTAACRSQPVCSSSSAVVPPRGSRHVGKTSPPPASEVDAAVSGNHSQHAPLRRASYPAATTTAAATGRASPPARPASPPPPPSLQQRPVTSPSAAYPRPAPRVGRPGARPAPLVLDDRGLRDLAREREIAERVASLVEAKAGRRKEVAAAAVAATAATGSASAGGVGATGGGVSPYRYRSSHPSSAVVEAESPVVYARAAATTTAAPAPLPAASGATRVGRPAPVAYPFSPAAPPSHALSLAGSSKPPTDVF